MCRWLAGVAFAGLLCCSTDALASGGPRPVRFLVSSTAATCVPDESLRLAIARRLGALPFDASAAETITVDIAEAEAPTLQANVVLHGPDGPTGRRTLSATGCEALIDRLAVTISVLLESGAAADILQAPARTPEPEELQDKHEHPAPALPEPSSESVRGFAACSAWGWRSARSEAAPSTEVSVEAVAGALAIGLGGRLDLPTSSLRADGKGVRASLLLGDAGTATPTTSTTGSSPAFPSTSLGSAEPNAGERPEPNRRVPRVAPSSVPSRLSRTGTSEDAFIDAAREALARGLPGETLAATDEHARRFPTGALTEEREALAIQALVALGRRREAGDRAGEFRKRFPESLLRRSVDRSLE